MMPSLAFFQTLNDALGSFDAVLDAGHQSHTHPIFSRVDASRLPGEKAAW
jgi:hypothetical protein